ncbi:carbohydrate ABC transporter, N-acetylglucosamine/diacetylchitobiose-binding protein, partial [Streptomyces sp. SID11233]|nr:carbohydrate ABC transporter, N-acetylglucosamine/diacetylchitobiose-binding protein [Streptomyces sp. SID11233]
MGSSRANGHGLGRRDLIKRSAAIGLVTVPTMSFLASCASSDSGSDDKPEKKGTKSKKNPLGVNESAPLDFVLFDGGFGSEYGKDAVAIYEKNFPKAQVKFTPTQKIQSTLQPRFNGGTPPDLIDNSGAEQMDMGVLVGKKQLADLTPL